MANFTINIQHLREDIGHGRGSGRGKRCGFRIVGPRGYGKPQQKRDDGLSLHGGADEHRMMLYLAPLLVSPTYRSAPSISGANYQESFAVARQPDWPGYIGAPKHASAALGQHIWDGFSAAAVTTTVEILNGADPATIPRYLSYLVKNPLYQQWIRSSNARDSTLGERQQTWRAGRARSR